MFKKFSWRYLCLIFLILACALPFYRKPGFNLSRISTSLDYRKEWAIDAPVTSSLDQILDQPFHYLGSGAQSYVFVSQDGNFVLKFFKMKHLTPKKWLKFFPLPGLSGYRYKKIELREARLNRIFEAMRAVYDHFREESGLIFIHLNRSKNLNKRVCLINRNNEKFNVSLDDVPFILQERAELIYKRLDFLMEKKERTAAIEALRSFLALIWTRGEKGFVDLDTGIRNNFGYIDERAVQIDVGGLSYIKEKSREDPRLFFNEFQRVCQTLESWLNKQYPELLPEFQNLILNYQLPAFDERK